jgi:tRNA-binding EMAP/Myf-like protein
MMDRDAVNAFCRVLPGADWSDSFGPGIDEWKVGGKLFAVIGAGAAGVSVKTPDVETAAMLIETGVGLRAPYFHRSWVLIPFRMKFTLSWLKDHLETDRHGGRDRRGADRSRARGRRGREPPADKLAPFTIGKVVKAEKHPDADRLRVCQVETDEGEKQIICGAPNAREGSPWWWPSRASMCRASTPPSASARSAASKATA